MRPDPHKTKATKRWKAKQGIPNPPRPTTSSSSSRSTHPESNSTTPQTQPTKPDLTPDDEEERLEAQRERAKFSRRKLESNGYRYVEPTPEDELADDAAVDRETEDLMELIKNADEAYDPSVYFQFKSEKQWTTADEVDQNDDIHRHLEINLADLESSLSTLPLHIRLGVEDNPLWHDISTPTSTSQSTPTPPSPSAAQPKSSAKPAQTKTPQIMPAARNPIPKPQPPPPSSDPPTPASMKPSSFHIQPQPEPAIVNKIINPIPPQTSEQDDLDFLLSLDQKDTIAPPPRAPIKKPSTTTKTAPAPAPASSVSKPASKNTDSNNLEDWLDDILG
ncbi:hypothetical protein HK097_000939 [Rhizophlyctis rosea]|uniref:Uncharacterized protein n=1 Tax=Rhizophlyctis rosea TaxID=64517 RepID=A0AAD5X137_9FUNG|nr:hypothetical protein HK097_000939 [Rhizophlyctis rosea]